MKPENIDPNNLPDRDLDHGLRAAFGSDPSHRAGNRSVLETLEEVRGSAPRVLLRDAAMDSEGSPLLHGNAGEPQGTPRGRGNYRLLGEMARGGMGAILKAHDTDLCRDIALKVLLREHSDRPTIVERFVEEAQIGGQLQHPGIVPVYEMGLMSDERPYFAMKLIKGRTLAELLSGRDSPDEGRRRFLGMFEQVCQTLAYAHSRNVVHRDLKPANVMVGAFGEVQVLDWGLAKVLGRGGPERSRRPTEEEISIIETVRSGPDSGTKSMSGSIMGTPAYMSPEQARGEVETLDERADVFSLGAMLTEILTGLPPYGDGPMRYQWAACTDLRNCHERLETCGADPELVALAQRCLAPDKSDRPRNAQALVEEVQSYTSSLEERARNLQIAAAEARGKVTQERKARRLTAGLAAAVLVTLTVAGSGWAMIEQDRTERTHQAIQRVTEQLSEARLLRTQGQWASALAAAQTALAHATAPEVDEALREQAERTLAEIRRESENRELIAALDRVREPEPDPAYPLYPIDWPEVDRAYGEVLQQFGLDADAGDEDAAAASIRRRGMAPELAARLDEWAMARELAGNSEGATRLRRVAGLVDLDETRGRLRDALSRRDSAELEDITQAGVFSETPAATLNLLGKALLEAGEAKESVSVYRDAQRLHPDDFVLNLNLARALRKLDVDRPEPPATSRPQVQRILHTHDASTDAAAHYMVALGLRPDHPGVRAELVDVLVGLGHEDRALSLAREAVRLWPRDPHLLFRLGLLLEDEPDEQIRVLRKMLARGPSSGERFVTYDLLDTKLTALGDLHGAYEIRRMELAERPHNFGAISSVAWYLAVAPDPERRNPEEAVRIALAATRAPGNENDMARRLQLLSVTLYSAQDWPACVDAATRARQAILEEGVEENCVCAALLAIAHHHLGEHGPAQTQLEAAEALGRDLNPGSFKSDLLAEARTLVRH